MCGPIINDQGCVYIIAALILMGIEDESHVLNIIVIVAKINILLHVVNLNYQ